MKRCCACGKTLPLDEIPDREQVIDVIVNDGARCWECREECRVPAWFKTGGRVISGPWPTVEEVGA